MRFSGSSENKFSLTAVSSFLSVAYGVPLRLFVRGTLQRHEYSMFDITEANIGLIHNLRWSLVDGHLRINVIR